MISQYSILREPIFYVFILILSGSLALILYYELVYVPQYNENVQKNLSKIDSLDCKELGEFILKASILLNSDGNHTPEYNYAFAKFHVVGCK
jgi:hypothetical protein